MRRIGVLAALLLVQAVVAAAPASAGGSHLSPVRDRYEAGDVATLVGYTSGGQLGWVEDGPFEAYLTTDGAGQDAPRRGLHVGKFELQPRGRTLRVSITFPIPGDLPPGLYVVNYCNPSCTTGLGDLIGGYLAVGVTPSHSLPRDWFLDDPEIANLADDAILTGPGYQVTAADVRAGRVTVPPGWDPVSPPSPRGERPSPPSTQVAPATPAPAPSPPAPVPEDSPSSPWPGAALVALVALVAAGALVARSTARRRQAEARPEPVDAEAPVLVEVGGPR